MDNKLLLVKAITLLYLNGKIKEKSSDAITIAKEVIQLVKPSDKFISSEFGTSDPVTELRNTLIMMSEKPLGYSFDEKELKQLFILNTGDHHHLLEALVASFVDEEKETEESLSKLFNSQKQAIKTYMDKDKVSEILKQFYVKAAYNPEQLDYKTLIEDLSNQLSPYTARESGDGIYNHPGMVGVTDMTNVESVGNVLTSAKEELDTRGVIRTPYQGINRMLGTHGGFRRGETTVITALTHNYKSGLTMDIYLGCALFNKPYMRDETKRPMNLRISFENTTRDDFKHIYPKLYEWKHGVKVDMRNIDVAEASEFISTEMDRNGYTSRVIHIDPSDFTYNDLFTLIEAIEEEGFEIHLLTIDYLNMMSKAGCVNETAGENIRDLFRRTRNFCLRRGITLVTPHQFSTEARKVERGEPSNFVKTVTGKGFYDGSSRLEHELDCEISIHIVDFNQERYLTLQRGKHRGVVTPVKDQYCVYKFEAIGGLPMDVEGDDMSRKSIGSQTEGEGGGESWMASLAI